MRVIRPLWVGGFFTDNFTFRVVNAIKRIYTDAIAIKGGFTSKGATMLMKRYSTHVLASVFAIIGACGFAMPGESAEGNPALTAQDKADMEYVSKLPRLGSAAELDLVDPVQYRYFLRQWELAGISAQSRPELLSAVEDLHQEQLKRNEAAAIKGPRNIKEDITPRSTQAAPLVPVNLLTDFGPGSRRGTFKVTLLSTVPREIGTTITSTVGFYDSNGNQIGTPKTVQQENKGTPVLNTNEVAVPPTGDVVVQGTYYYRGPNGQPHVGAVYSRQSRARLLKPVMINRNPADRNHDGIIKICINRKQKGCDYVIGKPGMTAIELPITDRFSVPDTLQSIEAQRVYGNFSAVLIPLGVGGGCTPTKDFDFWSGANISGRHMDWDFKSVPFVGTSSVDDVKRLCAPPSGKVIYDFQLLGVGSRKDVTTYWTGEVKTTSNPPSPSPPGVVHLVPMVIVQ